MIDCAKQVRWRNPFDSSLDALVQNGTEKTHFDHAFDRARFLRAAKTAQFSSEVQKPAHVMSL